jgi:hypothetical protein
MVKIELIAIECPEGKKIVKTEMESGLLLTYENLTQEEILNERLTNIEKQLSELQEKVDGVNEGELTPAEKFLLDTIEGVKVEKSDKYGDVSWFKDGKFLFRQEFKHRKLLVDYDVIWSVLRTKYGVKDFNIRQLINKVMYAYTCNGKLIPKGLISFDE